MEAYPACMKEILILSQGIRTDSFYCRISRAIHIKLDFIVYSFHICLQFVRYKLILKSLKIKKYNYHL